MATVRWSRRARGEYRASVLWLMDHRGPALAARMTADVAEAVARAAQYPEAYAWVGSVHATLGSLQSNIRRVLTRTRRYAVFYRYVADANEVQILAVRGAGQLPPTPDELRA